MKTISFTVLKQTAMISALILLLSSCQKKENTSDSEQKPRFMTFIEKLTASCNQNIHDLNQSNPLKKTISPTNKNNPYDKYGVAHNKAIDFIGNKFKGNNPQIDTVVNIAGNFYSFINAGAQPPTSWAPFIRSKITEIKANGIQKSLNSIHTLGIVSENSQLLITIYYRFIQEISNPYNQIEFSKFFETTIESSQNYLTDSEKEISIGFATIYKYSVYYWTAEVLNPTNPWNGLPPFPSEINGFDAFGFIYGQYYCQTLGLGANSCNCFLNPNCLPNVGAAAMSVVFSFI